ncbi:MAG: Hpt domain-containing protein [bacterium]
MSETTTIDVTVIEQLKELVDDEDPDFLTDLFQEYLEDVTTHLSKLVQSIEAMDTVTVVKTAHTLKGASSNLGARHMAELFTELEKTAKREDADGARKLLSELQKEFGNVRKAMSAYL